MSPGISEDHTARSVDFNAAFRLVLFSQSYAFGANRRTGARSPVDLALGNFRLWCGFFSLSRARALRFGDFWVYERRMGRMRRLRKASRAKKKDFGLRSFSCQVEPHILVDVQCRYGVCSFHGLRSKHQREIATFSTQFVNESGRYCIHLFHPPHTSSPLSTITPYTPHPTTPYAPTPPFQSLAPESLRASPPRPDAFSNRQWREAS